MVSIQFDRYLALRQQEEPGPNSGTTPDIPSGVRITPSLFGDDQLAKARKMRSARDAQRELDPRAELKLYLDEPLYEGDLSPMGWWKVSSNLHPPGVIGT
jgi:hypothetical protein